MLFEHVFPNWKRAELAEVFLGATLAFGLVGTLAFKAAEDMPLRTEQTDCSVMTLEKN